MSDLVPGSVSLEDENPSLETIAQTPPAPETPPPAPETPPPAVEQDPDGTIEGSGGVKFVPLNAVVELRGKVRETKTALEAKDAEIAALKGKADRLDQIQGEWNRAQPLIEQLKNGTYQPQQTQKPQINEKVAQYAKDFDLYKTDGTPDIERAQRIIDFHDSRAREQAQALVQPIYQNTAQQQSVNNRHAVGQWKAPNGMPVDPAVIDKIWSMVPPEMSARPEVANMLWRESLVEQMLSGAYKPPVTAPPPPVITESLGGNTTKPELSAVDRNMMSAASIKGSDYEKISANYKPGERNALE